MLSSLRSRVEEQIGMAVESAGVATLNLVTLYPDDMQDAFEYVGLRYLTFPVRYGTTYETSAAYAGYKFGLCFDYTNRSACKQEQVKVLLMGDCVHDETFQRILRQTLSRQMEDLPEILGKDLEGVAAKGAAEFAKRIPYDPYRI